MIEIVVTLIGLAIGVAFFFGGMKIIKKLGN